MDPGMEQAFFVSTTDNMIKYYRPEFDRLYFGNEFCERLIPPLDSIKQALDFASEMGIGFTFVTPYVTNAGLETVEKVIDFIDSAVENFEVVFNDWGVFQYLTGLSSRTGYVMGRLLNKQKRGPRIMNIIDKVPSDTRDFYRGSLLDVPAAAGFLKKNHINRVEFDNLLQGIDLETSDPDISKSLYLPFAFVSTTRFCLTANCDSDEPADCIGIFPCARECRKYTFELVNPVMKQPLIRRGNTVFFFNDRIPEPMTEGRFNRVVVEPEIPL